MYRSVVPFSWNAAVLLHVVLLTPVFNKCQVYTCYAFLPLYNLHARSSWVYIFQYTFNNYFLYRKSESFGYNVINMFHLDLKVVYSRPVARRRGGEGRWGFSFITSSLSFNTKRSAPTCILSSITIYLNCAPLNCPIAKLWAPWLAISWLRTWCILQQY